uniref:Uncharacterized protein n=1 Tax=uncultured bacterium pAG2 TaxID=1781152 RepID=A0A1C9U4I3_9BACT|nr:hypothetical protein [uncultured bacterium pAG2]
MYMSVGEGKPSPFFCIYHKLIYMNLIMSYRCSGLTTFFIHP